jgi:hypothetical protein
MPFLLMQKLHAGLIKTSGIYAQSINKHRSFFDGPNTPLLFKIDKRGDNKIVGS